MTKWSQVHPTYSSCMCPTIAFKPVNIFIGDIIPQCKLLHSPEEGSKEFVTGRAPRSLLRLKARLTAQIFLEKKFESHNC